MGSALATLLPAFAIFVVGGATGALLVALMAMKSMTALTQENAQLRSMFDGEALPQESTPREPLRLPIGRKGALGILVLLLLAGAPSLADAQTAPKPQDVAAADSGRDENALQYCRSIVNAASDARFARQQAALATMEKEIEARIAQLEAKRAEYQDWLQRRETFLKKADDSLVSVISQMRPDAASAQISAMTEDMGAAVLAKLSPRVASAILNEMDPNRAARLTSTMVGISRRSQEGKAG
ncbi:MAG: hypothetical protein B7Z15_11270 [Rhizobiales bacterium 32-66-8]|nr:MAG: hypothetical protein B7Z15_11270 [Rhizobiales bacterium 32-66-8]